MELEQRQVSLLQLNSEGDKSSYVWLNEQGSVVQ